MSIPTAGQLIHIAAASLKATDKLLLITGTVDPIGLAQAHAAHATACIALATYLEDGHQ